MNNLLLLIFQISLEMLCILLNEKVMDVKKN